MSTRLGELLVKRGLITSAQLDKAIEHHQGEESGGLSTAQVENEDVELVRQEEDVDVKELERATEDAPVVRLVNAILTSAIKRRASDIHLEPFERMFRVRYRVDGVLEEIMKPPLKLKNAI